MPNAINQENSVEVDELQKLREENEQLRLQLQQSQQERMQEHQQQSRRDLRSDQIASKAREQVHAVLSALGMSSADIQDFVQHVGGISSLVELDENDVPRVRIGDRLLSIDQALPLHPLIQRRANVNNDPSAKLRKQIHESEVEIGKLTRYCQQNPQDNVSFARLSVIRRETVRLHQELESLSAPQEPGTKPRGYADPDLISQRDTLAREIQERKARLTEADPIEVPAIARLVRQHREIVATIQKQIGD